MAITLVGVGTWAGGTGAIAPGLPAGLVDGDWLFLAVESANEAVATPAGWTQASVSPQGQGTAGAIGAVRLTLFHRVFAAGVLAPSVADSGNHTVAQIAAFRGVDSINAAAGAVNTITGIDVVMAPVTTTADNTLVAVFIAGDRDIATTDTQLAASFTLTPSLDASPMTKIFDRFASSGTGGGVAAAYGTKAVAGAVNDSSYRLSSNNFASAHIVLALAESGGGIVGTLAAQEAGSDVAAATGAVPVAGSLASTEAGQDSAAVAGTVSVAGALGAAESGTDGFAGSGSVAVQGTLAGQESGADSFAASGTVGSTAISGTLAATESGADGFTSSGTVAISGTLATTETGSDTSALVGTVAIAGALAANEAGSDTFTGSGAPSATGALTAVETGSDGFAAAGTVAIAGALAGAETGSDGFAATGTVAISGALATQEAGEDGFAASGTIGTAAGGGQIKHWNGSAWVAKPVKVWNGSTWLEKPLKFWSGSAWVLA